MGAGCIGTGGVMAMPAIRTRVRFFAAEYFPTNYFTEAYFPVEVGALAVVPSHHVPRWWDAMPEQHRALLRGTASRLGR